MKRTEIINQIIKEKRYASYLEIGLGDGANFKGVICESKIGVDPDVNVVKFSHFRTNGQLANVDSDQFFTKSDLKFDLIFIDGLHHSDQVERDIINSWNCLNPNGTILIHDIKPLDEKSQRVPREQVAWTGDVWRAWYGLKNQYSKLKLSYIDERVGLGVIEKSRHKIEVGFVDTQTSYQEYNEVKGWNVK